MLREIRMLTSLRQFTPNRIILQQLDQHATPRYLLTTRASSTTNPAETHNVQLPLCERNPSYSTELASIIDWHRQALIKVANIGDAWVLQDDGPSQQDLETELCWLLDDAIAQVIDDTGAPPQPTTWRALERQLKTGALLFPEASTMIVLRETLQHIDSIWNDRLERRIPLQYLTSAAYWRDYIFSVGPGVLIPRPETELMIDFVLEELDERPELAQGQWADLGTGSGALAISLAIELPDVPAVWAVDAAPEPAAHAAFNAERLGVSDRVHILRGSWYDPIKAKNVQKLAGIVSNPPYIPSKDLPSLQAEVGRHEPHMALDGGQDMAIDCLKPICHGAVDMLQSGGFLVLETGGKEQAEYVADMLRDLNAFEEIKVRSDLRSVDRFVSAVRL